MEVLVLVLTKKSYLQDCQKPFVTLLFHPYKEKWKNIGMQSIEN